MECPACRAKMDFQITDSKERYAKDGVDNPRLLERGVSDGSEYDAEPEGVPEEVEVAVCEICGEGDAGPLGFCAGCTRAALKAALAGNGGKVAKVGRGRPRLTAKEVEARRRAAEIAAKEKELAALRGE